MRTEVGQPDILAAVHNEERYFTALLLIHRYIET